MAVSMLIPILIAALIVIIIAIIAGVKNTHEKGGEDVIKHVYVYLVLFATLMMTIGGSVATFMAAADIIAPAPYYQSFEDYKRWNTSEKPSGENTDEEVTLSDEELRDRYDAMVEAEKDRQISRAKNNLIKSFGWIIIPLPIFIYFQRRLARKEE